MITQDNLLVRIDELLKLKWKEDDYAVVGRGVFGYRFYCQPAMGRR